MRNRLGILLLLVAVCLLGRGAVAQTECPGCPSPARVTGFVRPRPTTVEGGNFEIALLNTAGIRQWVLGVRAEEGESAATVRIGEFVLQLHEGRVVGFSAVQDWPDTQVGLKAGRVEIDCRSGSDRALAVLARVPRGVQVRVWSDGVPVSSVMPSPSFLLSNGHAVPREVQSLATLAGVILSPDETSAKDIEPIATPSGDYFVSPAALRARIEHFARPVYPAKVRVSESHTVHLVVTIDDTGKVSGIRVLRGGAEFAEAARSAVSQWRFTPFASGGKSVPVKTEVFFVFDPEGRVKSPIFD